MNVLIVHNLYQQRGGEDMVVDSEVALLRAHGHVVDEYRRHNDEISSVGRLRAAAGAIWSHRTRADLAERIQARRPDILHIHNTLPLISPSVYWAAADAGIPVVQTLHNFRLLCPQAMLLRDGRVCESCVGRLPLPGVLHGCYRGSRAQSAVLATSLVLHRAIGTWSDKVHRYIALNEFCRRKFIQGGLPAERIAIKPNFVEDLHTAAADAGLGQRTGLLFVGRLSPEKGIAVLAQAAQGLPAACVRVAGVGPEVHLVEAQPALAALGALSASQVRGEMASAVALVMPSIWYENFPRTLVEAFADGLPVIVSRLGALASLVDDSVNGLHFDAGNAADLAAKMRWALDHPERMAEMGRAARRTYEQHYTPAVNYRQLMGVYRQAAEEQARSGASVQGAAS